MTVAGFEATVLARLGAVGLQARQAVESILAGNHRSLRPGPSLDIAGHSPYVAGDDVRRIDWQVWARTDRLEVRQFHDETRLTVNVVVDASGSMGYAGTGRLNKLGYARLLAAGLGYLCVRNGDAVGLTVLGADAPKSVAPGTGMGRLLQVLDVLQNLRAHGTLDVGIQLGELSRGRRGLIVVLSDLFTDPVGIQQAMARLRHRRHEVRLVGLLDPDETTLPFHGHICLRGLEGEGVMRVDADRVAGFYRQHVNEFQRSMTQLARAQGIASVWIRTDLDPARALAAILSSGSKKC